MITVTAWQPLATKLMHQFEGCKLTAYPDPGSKDGTPWTIGWGSTGPGIRKGIVWTQEQCDQRFADDLIMVVMQPCAYMRRAGASTGPVLAQFEASQTNPRYVLTGAPMYRMPHATDGVHLTNAGFKLQGAYFGKANAAILAGKKPQWLRPLSAVYSGSVVRVKFDVPCLPLQFDATTLGATTTEGFKVLDNGSAATINSVTIEGDTVVLTCASSFTGPVKVRCALDYLGSNRNIDSGASSTLRDSTPDTITISGTAYQLFSCAPSFEITAVNGGV